MKFPPKEFLFCLPGVQGGIDLKKMHFPAFFTLYMFGWMLFIPVYFID